MPKFLPAISRKNLPATLSIAQILAYITALKVFNAPQWLWGIVIFIIVIISISSMYQIVIQEQVEISHILLPKEEEDE